MQHPYFGWGGWGRSRVYSEVYERDISVTDSTWIIALGCNGLFGLISVLSLFALPVLLTIWRYPARLWADREVAPAIALALLIGIYLIDNLMNGMINPVYLLALGGLSGLPRPEQALEDTEMEWDEDWVIDEGDEGHGEQSLIPESHTGSE